MAENEGHFRGVDELLPRLILHRHALRPEKNRVSVFMGDNVVIVLHGVSFYVLF
jgi:hypothetical protein